VALFPALAGNPSVLAEDTTSLIRMLVEGGNSPLTLTGAPRQQMPEFADTLADVQIAQVLTYIRGAWGNAQGITGNDVSSLRQLLQITMAAPAASLHALRCDEDGRNRLLNPQTTRPATTQVAIGNVPAVLTATSIGRSRSSSIRRRVIAAPSDDSSFFSDRSAIGINIVSSSAT
jgi:hypothetical protein